MNFVLHLEMRTSKSIYWRDRKHSQDQMMGSFTPVSFSLLKNANCRHHLLPAKPQKMGWTGSWA